MQRGAIPRGVILSRWPQGQGKAGALIILGKEAGLSEHRGKLETKKIGTKGGPFLGRGESGSLREGD